MVTQWRTRGWRYQQRNWGRARARPNQRILRPRRFHWNYPMMKTMLKSTQLRFVCMSMLKQHLHPHCMSEVTLQKHQPSRSHLEALLHSHPTPPTLIFLPSSPKGLSQVSLIALSALVCNGDSIGPRTLQKSQSPTRWVTWSRPIYFASTFNPQAQIWCLFAQSSTGCLKI